MPNVVDDIVTGIESRIPGLPDFPGQDVDFSRDGRLFATDTRLTGAFEGPPGYWGVAVAEVRGTRYVMLHNFDNSYGARTWRVSHPHPIFSPDSKRLCFNVSSSESTQLLVAESVAGDKLTSTRRK